MNNKNIIIILFLLFYFNYSPAQNEDNIWYFGKNGAGLDFNSHNKSNFCEPVVLTDGTPNNVFWEGAVSMCDKNTGQLLFYTDGVFIYDATHNQMTGNAAGFFNTNTQNTIIPKPGSNNIYYLICPEAQAFCSFGNLNHPGMIYSVVDMNLNGGLGGIVSSFNNLVDSPNCEKITAVRNSNGQDIWLIGHKYRSNVFFVLDVTSAGINTTPAYYSMGPVINTTQGGIGGINCFDAIGELKASPNGRKIAFTTFYSGISALFDFDNSTGVISNPIILNLGYTGYGVSFSPDNLKLYIGGGDSSTITTSTYNGRLFQFDISSNDSTIINNSKTLIYFSPTSSYGSLKLAPNGKMYATLHTGNTAYGSDYLEVINYPDNTGLACGYLHNGLFLNGLNSSWGLNNIMERNTYCDNPTTADNLLEGNKFNIFPNPSKGIVNFFIEENLIDCELNIFDLFGKNIYKKYLNKNTKENIILNLRKGIYFVRVRYNDKDENQKIIIE
jgi:hypothetical protein